MLLRPVRTYYESLCQQVNDRDVESGWRDRGELQRSRGVRNQPRPVSQPQPYYLPYRLERKSEFYPDSGT